MSTFWLNSGGNLVALKSFASTLAAIRVIGRRRDVLFRDKYVLRAISRYAM